MQSHRASRTLLVLMSASLILGLSACSSLKVSHEYDRDASFASYESFAFLSSKSIADEDLKEVVKILIVDELTSKGLTRDGEQPDLLVTYDGWRDSREQIATGLGYAVETSGGVTTVYTASRGVPLGALVIGLVDRDSGTLVWKASAQAALKPGADPKTRLKNLERAIAKMFGSYPPK